MSLDFTSSSSEYIDIGNSLSLLDNFTAAFRLNISNITNNQKFIDFRSNPGSAYGWLCQIWSSTNFRFDGGDGVGWTNIGSYWDISSLSSNTTYHFCFTRAGSTHKFYVDGVENTNRTTHGTSTSNVAYGTDNFNVARQNNNSGYVDGELWDVLLFDTVLTDAEVAILSEHGGNAMLPHDPIWFARLNEDTPGNSASGANSITDLSTGGNDGTPYNTPVYAGRPVTILA